MCDICSRRSARDGRVPPVFRMSGKDFGVGVNFHGGGKAGAVCMLRDLSPWLIYGPCQVKFVRGKSRD